MNQLAARPLPQNLEAERALLGAILVNNDVFWDVVSLLTRDHWYEPYHAELWTLMRDLIETDRQATPQTMMHDLAQDADIGGMTATQYLRRLVDEAVPAMIARDLATTIRDLGDRRQQIAAAHEWMEALYTAPASTTGRELLAEHEAITERLFTGVADIGVEHVADVGKRVMKRIAAAMRNDEPLGVGLPLASLENLIGPLMPGRLVIIAGGSGSGKTVLAQQIAEHVAASQVVLMSEMEMPPEEIVERSLARATGIPGDKIERAALRVSEYDPLQDAANGLGAGRFYIDRTPAITVSRLRGRAARLRRKVGLGLVVVDHLQHLGKPDKGMDQFEALRANLQGLKRLGLDLGVPVVLLAQLKGDYNAVRDIRPPSVGDLFHGAAVEQEADVLLFIFREEHELVRRRPSDQDPKYAEWLARKEAAAGVAEFILVKRRGGRGHGSQKCGFDGARYRFLDNYTKVAADARIASLADEQQRALDLAR